MRDEKQMISRGIAQAAQSFLEPMGRHGLIKFLHEQITDAEWKIARCKAEIAAYEQAIAAIEGGAEKIESVISHPSNG